MMRISNGVEKQMKQRKKASQIKKVNQTKKAGIKYSLLLLCMMIVLGGCGASKRAENSSSAADMAIIEESNSLADNTNGWSGSEYGAQTLEGSEDVKYDSVQSQEKESVTVQSESNTSNAVTGRKLVKRVNLDMQTLTFDTFMTNVQSKVSFYNGYIENSNVYYGTYDFKQSRNANITIRIPAESLDAFVNDMGNEANIINKTESAEDITSSYIDTQSRKKSLAIQQERLLSLLEKAETMEDIVALEQRLSEVTYELERSQAVINNYDNLVTYSTVTIFVSEVSRVTQVEEETMGARIKAGVDDSLYNIKETMIEWTIRLIVNLPYLLIWAVVLGFAAVFVIKRHKKKLRGERERSEMMSKYSQKEQEQQKQE